MSLYPTSPPWSPPPPAPQASSPSADDQPYTTHGQLLVRYPEEMHNAVRPRPPAVWPVAAFTVFFGLLGAISAARRAGQARRSRNSSTPYWVTFVVTLAVSGVLSLVVAASVAVPAYLALRESAVTATVRSNLVHDGRLKTLTGASASAATCATAGARAADGLREYACLFTLADGRTGTIEVAADMDGNWQPAK
ncbi:MAG: hypothetical protein QOH97_5529 [Actinoplanes sp.]|nr:hypothetical protein [Actinoplanes sp.]